MQGRASYITLPVPDLHSAVTFYEAVFLWPQHRSVPTACFFELPNITIALMDANAFTDFAGTEIASTESASTMFSWNVTSSGEIDELIDRATASGATVQRPVSKLDWGCWAGIIRTPEGHLWEIVWNPKLD